MDASVAAALASGRSVIVPSPQRAAALALAWARTQLAAQRSVWSSPDILTWDAWLQREWQHAAALGQVPAELICLGSGQELLVWQAVLDDLEPGAGLRQFAPELMRAAARATQEGVRIGSQTGSEEEQLLVRALPRVRERCKHASLVALALQPLESLQQFVHSAAPLFIGQQRMTCMQAALALRKWPATQMLANPPAVNPTPQFVRAASFEAEVCAAADWCHGLLGQDGSRRLLIVSALSKPGLPALGNLLWRALSADTAQQIATVRDPAMLAIEGGESLLEHGLIADALDALQLMRDPVEMTHLGRVLLSPYFGVGTDGARARLEMELRDRGRARWATTDLKSTLYALGNKHPAAAALAEWLSQVSRLPGARAAPASSWAREFSACLARCRFAAATQLDSRDAQRLERWNELLDELASLDCVTQPMSAGPALEQLRLLAARGRHRAASGDAAITLTDDLGDPVTGYDGIWVLGLAESRWPRPPRPNPFVPLSEQRRCDWPEATVTQRLEQARWAQQCWGARTSRLVLSYPAMEGDVHHRPSSLLPAPAASWASASTVSPALRIALARAAVDEALPPVSGDTGSRLRHGVRLLELQQQCAFRAQAELRLGATPTETVSDGIDKRLRGTLLHRTLEGLWREVADQQHLAALSEVQRLDVIDRCWQLAVARSPADTLPADPRVLEREASRTRGVLSRVLELEAGRAPFRVLERELTLQASFAGRELSLRVDRVDELQDGRCLLIDYKSGRPDKMQLEDVNIRPIQLAAYVAAVLAQGSRADAVALLSVSPKEKELGFSGRAEDAAQLPPKIKQLEAWAQHTRDWRLQVERLIEDHVHGLSMVAPLPGACDFCHLDSLCRITFHPPDPDEEVVADE